MNSDLVKEIINSIEVVQHEGEWHIKIDDRAVENFEASANDLSLLGDCINNAVLEAEANNQAMKGKSKPKT
tara:strand:+ start:230 stop:442 length:213 start_codon:yes stop_codon:yes gene_type:complete